MYETKEMRASVGQHLGGGKVKVRQHSKDLSAGKGSSRMDQFTAITPHKDWGGGFRHFLEQTSGGDPMKIKTKVLVTKSPKYFQNEKLSQLDLSSVQQNQ